MMQKLGVVSVILKQEDLKKHSDIKHKPSPANKKPNTYDKCYDCQLIVNGYKELMSHKKEVHPSTKRCRNLDDGTCRFGRACWYAHDTEARTTDETEEHETENFKCNSCGALSKTRNEMEKHNQEEHPTRVTTENKKRCYVCDLEVNDIMELMSHRKEHHPPNKKCRNLGTCRFGERCWYAHETTETDEAKEP